MTVTKTADEKVWIDDRLLRHQGADDATGGLLVPTDGEIEAMRVREYKKHQEEFDAALERVFGKLTLEERLRIKGFTE